MMKWLIKCYFLIGLASLVQASKEIHIDEASYRKWLEKTKDTIIELGNTIEGSRHKERCFTEALSAIYSKVNRASFIEAPPLSIEEIIEISQKTKDLIRRIDHRPPQ